jgi:hypothetical protein
VKLYHFTFDKNLPGIRKRGLLPHHPACECHKGIGKVVWFTTFAPRPGEARALSVEFDRSDKRLEPVKGDPGWWVYRGTIPPWQVDFNGL